MKDTHDSMNFGPFQTRYKLNAHRWLSLAAAPSFVVLALLNHNQAGVPAFCAAVPAGSPLSGMVPMYVLMCVVHITPWLTLLNRSRRLRERC